MSDSKCTVGQTAGVALLQTKHVVGGPGEKETPPDLDKEETLLAHWAGGPASGEATTTQGPHKVHSERGNKNFNGDDTAEPRMAEEQRRLYLDLHSAKRARQATLEQWDLIGVLRDYLQDLVCIALIVLSVFFMIQNIYQCEADRDKDLDPPWYHDSACLTKVLSAALLLWLLSGITLFTRFLVFTDASDTQRHLSTIDSIYLMTQIITTVGYGDLTPNSDAGKAMLVLYALTGVSFIAAFVQQQMFNFVSRLQQQEVSEEEDVGDANATHDRILGKHHESVMNFLTVLLFLLFGTVFYRFYPGEDKTIVESFYMSTITLLTIGFGAIHPTTEVGKLVACFWMLAGVTCMAQVVASCTSFIFKTRNKLSVRAAAARLFAKLDADNSGTIDCKEFVMYELVRRGVSKTKVEQAFSKFANLDKDGSGGLDIGEFQKYVATLHDDKEHEASYSLHPGTIHYRALTRRL